MTTLVGFYRHYADIAKHLISTQNHKKLADLQQNLVS